MLLRWFLDVMGWEWVENEFLEKKKTTNHDFSATVVVRIWVW
jgi:hypothetical protein